MMSAVLQQLSLDYARKNKLQETQNTSKESSIERLWCVQIMQIIQVKVRDNLKSRYDKLVKKHLGGFLLQIPPDTLEAM